MNRCVMHYLSCEHADEYGHCLRGSKCILNDEEIIKFVSGQVTQEASPRITASINIDSFNELIFQLRCVQEHLKFISVTDESVNFDISVLDACILQLSKFLK